MKNSISSFHPLDPLTHLIYFLFPSLTSASPLGFRHGHPRNKNYSPGEGAKAPESFNNTGLFGLFGILGAAMVVASIWFFFWAKNGGFVWRKGDWDDYKSTVLRRKDKNGKTLSNATPSTDLGEKSIAGTFDIEQARKNGYQDEKSQYKSEDGRKSSRPHKKRRQPSDEDLRAYRQEKPARVGGMNRQQDGSTFDYSSTEPSEVVSNNSRQHLAPTKPTNAGEKKPNSPEKTKKAEKKREKQHEKEVRKAEKKQESANRKEEKKQKKAEKKEDKEKSKHAKKLDDDKTNQTEQSSVPEMSEYHPRSGRRQSFTTAESTTVADETEYSYGGTNTHTYMSAYRPPAPPTAPSRRNETARHYGRHRPTDSPSRASPRHSTANTNSDTSGLRRSSPVKRSSPRSSRYQAPGSFDAYSEAGSTDTGTRTYTHHIPELSRGNRDPGFRRGGNSGGRRDSLSDSDEGDLSGFRRR